MKTAQYTKSLTVSLRPEVYDRIKRITDQKHISIGEWVRDAIENALSTMQPKEELMK
jgi:predicted HicB family RNase H-like nuclease